MDEGARDRLTSNIAGSLAGAQAFIRQRAIANFAKVCTGLWMVFVFVSVSLCVYS